MNENQPSERLKELLEQHGRAGKSESERLAAAVGQVLDEMAELQHKRFQVLAGSIGEGYQKALANANAEPGKRVRFDIVDRIIEAGLKP